MYIIGIESEQSLQIFIYFPMFGVVITGFLLLKFLTLQQFIVSKKEYG